MDINVGVQVCGARGKQIRRSQERKQAIFPRFGISILIELAGGEMTAKFLMGSVGKIRREQSRLSPDCLPAAVEERRVRPMPGGPKDSWRT
jgi:hypothetical protein